MKRPLVPRERVEVELSNLDSVEPAIANLIACTLFQVGLLIGGYPGGRVRVVLCQEDDTETLRMQVDMSIPLEELDT